MPKVDTLTREEWEKHYDPMHKAFQELFMWHMLNAPSPEEMQLRIVMDMAITVVNLFIVNSPMISERELRKECLDFIENMKRCIERDDLKTYCINHGNTPVAPTQMEDQSL